MNFWQELKKPIIGLAPMDGVTDYPMRQIQVSIAKPDVMYTEFISVEGFNRKPIAFKDSLYFSENERPIVVQLFGHTPQAFHDAILDIGHLKFDGIDINMGCPAKSILERGGGGALIGNYKLAESIILRSLEAISKIKNPIPLSVKTRIGNNENLTKEWFSFLSNFPLAEVTVHGRFIKQKNVGGVNWNEIENAAQILHYKNIICLGNGGIKSISHPTSVKAKDGFLIGQAVCGNPWIFAGRKPSKEEILTTILKHAKLVSEYYEEKKFVTVLKHFSWYPKSFKNAKDLKIQLLKTRNLAEVEEVLLSFE